MSVEVEQPKLEKEEEEAETGDSKVQPLEVEDDEEKFFIVQSLEDKETEQDRVVALMDSSDYEDITDVFRDIEIEDLEAEKENVVGGNNVATEVEKLFVRDSNNSSQKKKLQETSKVDSCLEAYEEIII